MKRLQVIATILVGISDALLILVFSILGAGPSVYNGAATGNVNLIGNAILFVITLTLLAFFIFDLHKCTLPVRVFFGVGLLTLMILASICKAMKYPWVGLLICLMVPPALFGGIRANSHEYSRSVMHPKDFLKAIGVGFVICGCVVLAIWFIWVVTQNRWLNNSTEDWLAEKFPDVYKNIYSDMELDYDQHCSRNKDLRGFDETTTSEIEAKCEKVEDIWSLVWAAPIIIFACNFLGACFCNIVAKATPVRAPLDSDLSATIFALKKFVLTIAIAISAMYCSLYVSGAASSLGSGFLCIGAIATSAALGWIYLEVDHSKIQKAINESDIGHNIIKLMHSDWTRAIAVGGLHLFIPFFGYMDRLRKKQRVYFDRVEDGSDPTDVYTAQGRRIRNELARWNWVSILTKVNFLGELFMLLLVGSKATFVFFSWLNTTLDKSSLGFGEVTILVLFVGLFMFMNPIVPGSAVYLFAGVVLAQQGDSGDVGFWAGFVTACIVGSVAKHIACLGQYGLGYVAGKNVRVQKFVGVDTVNVRAMERLLKEPGLQLGKVSLLVAGPDFPTSMLCGILKLEILQMLLGTCPVILVSIIPQTLVGALLIKGSGIWSTLSAVATGGAAFVQAAAVLVFTWSVMKIVEQHSAELAVHRPEHEAVELLTKSEEAYVQAYADVTRWEMLRQGQKVLLLGSSGAFLLSGFVLAADYAVTEKFCLLSFSINDKISDPVDQGGLDNNVMEMILPLGFVMLALAFIAFVMDIIFGKWKAREAREVLARDGPRNSGAPGPALVGKQADAEKQTTVQAVSVASHVATAF